MSQIQEMSRSASVSSSENGPGRDELLRIYRSMHVLRKFEFEIQNLYKKGKLPGFVHLYIGEEAVAAGVCAHLTKADVVTSSHRGHGHALAKGVPATVVMAELYGKATGCSGGRGGSMHLYSKEWGLLGSNGLVAAGFGPAVGAGVAAVNRGTKDVGVVFFGDGAAGHGAFHESINFAAVQKYPVVFVCENNGYATATPITTGQSNPSIAAKAAGYGIPGVCIDGNDIYAVWKAAKEAIDRARAGKGPSLIECKTYRWMGHNEGEPLYGTYRTKEEVEGWKLKCPILALRRRLEKEGVPGSKLDEIEASAQKEIDDSVKFAEESPACKPEQAVEHVWGEPVAVTPPTRTLEYTEQGWLKAVIDGIAEEMRRNPNIVYFGEGIGERGGAFAHTKGLWGEFSGKRMVDTPICELAFTGAAIGSSALGVRAVADLMFCDFAFDAASQIIHQAAKLRSMSAGQLGVPMLLRTAVGAIKSSGAHHSGTYHSIWAHAAGLLVVVPSTPADAKGLMKTALRSPDPVMFMEPKVLFATKGQVPVGDDILIPFGQAKIVREGTGLTIVSFGAMVHKSMEAAEKLQAEGISCEVIDLRTIVPMDIPAIVASLSKTHKLLVVDEGWSMCGVGAEIAATIMEHAFDELDAPVGRLHTEPTAYPFAPILEEATVPTVDKIMKAAKAVLAGQPLPQRRAPSAVSSAAAPERPAAPAPAAAAPAAPAPVAAAAGGAGEPVCMPHGDLTVTEATVVKWLKKVGDKVKTGEPLVEMETDKAVSEIESPADGVLSEILTPPKTVVKLGDRLGTVRKS